MTIVAALLAVALIFVFPRDGPDVGPLGAPTVAQTCAQAGKAASLTVTCAAPPGAGNVIVASVCYDEARAAIAAPAGFSPLPNQSAGYARTFYRVAAPGDGRALRIALPKSMAAAASVVEWKNVETTRPFLFAAFAGAGNVTAPATPRLPPIVKAPVLPVLAACLSGAVRPRLGRGWSEDGARTTAALTVLSAHANTLTSTPAQTATSLRLAGPAAHATTMLAFLNPGGSARTYVAPVAAPAVTTHVNVVTYGCLDATVPCGGATPVPSAWWAAHATMMMSNRWDMAAFKKAGGAHLLFYTDPNKIVPTKHEAFWNMPEAAFCHSSLPPQTITVTTNVRKGVQYVDWTGAFTPGAGNTAVADTTTDPDDIKFITVDAAAHTFSAEFGKPHRAPFTVALNRLYNTQNNPRGGNAAEDRAAYGNDNLLVPSRATGFDAAYAAVLREYASIPGADYVEVDDVYGDYPSILYNFFTETGRSARGTACAEAPTRQAYHTAIVLEFLAVIANGLQPIADGASNMDSTQNNDPPGPSENVVFHPYVSGDLNNEGCIVGTPLYKGEKLWLADQTQSLTATSRRKINICMAQTPTGPGDALNGARVFFYASNMLVYDPAFSYLFEDLGSGRAHIFVFPEEQIVPSSPVESASGVDVRTLKYRYPRLKRGAYFREFAACYENGRPIGGCAFFVNPTSGALTMPPQASLATTYARAATVNTPNLYDGGTVTWQPWTLPREIPGESALIVKH
ncbi:MAG: hypothetical protein ABR591_13480 [Candidatus Velthaea sp.]